MTSLKAVNILMRDCCYDDHPLRDIIRDIRELFLQDWNVKLYHTSWDNIFYADYMAKEGDNPSADEGVILIPTIPRGCLHMALKDQLACCL